MALGRTLSVTLHGLAGALVEVEADLSMGLPIFLIGGLPDAACRQSSDRIKAAAANSGLPLPQRRITVNLSPASLPKHGAGFDLGIAVAVLVAAGVVPAAAVADVAHLGELGLDGAVRAVRGVLPAVMAAAALGCRAVVVPEPNVAEARLVPGVRVTAARTLTQVVRAHRGEPPVGEPAPRDRAPHADDGQPGQGQDFDRHADDGQPGQGRDLADVVGQEEARLALEVAAAGGHHVFLVGPPGAGKTMLAECLPTLLPPLAHDHALEVTAIHSVLGVLPAGALIRRPPFVAPHHGASMAAIIGGGSGQIRPGLVSQAHRGVLFLDEAPEFRLGVLQSLRQPLESGQVVVARASGSVTYPARCQLVLAANPCPCGKGHGKGQDCSCAAKARRDYLSRLAGPLLDRVDVRVQVPAVGRAALAAGRGEPSSTVAARVRQARAAQLERLRGTPYQLNADIPGPRLRAPGLRLPPAATTDLDRAVDRGVLTLRGYDRVLRLAWTLRDLRGGGAPDREDVGLALTLRAHAGVAA